jgi:predicted metal-dependent enzyme (double-stranded beta helix superfamily)
MIVPPNRRTMEDLVDGSYSVDAYVEDLRRIVGGTGDEGKIFDQLGPCAQRLATDQSWIKPEYAVVEPGEGFSVRVLHEEADHSLAVFVVAWEPGNGVVPHDHGTWAVVAGIEGPERNTTYARLDDRGRAGYAEIEVKKDSVAGPGDLVCIKTGGIHSVWNDTDKVTLSLHTYGMHVNYTKRHQFDLETNVAEEFKITVE